MPALDELRHLPEQEGEDQRADVRAVDVGVRHHDHAVITQFLDVVLVADPGPDRSDHRLDLGVRQHLVDPILLGVDHLAAQRQNRLVDPVSGLDGRPSGGVPLDEEELGVLGIIRLAVGQLAGQRRALESAFASRQLARLARRLARVPGSDRLGDDLLRVGRILLEKLGEALVHGLLDEATHPRVAELRLRLALELRVAELDRDDGGEALADILAFEVVLLLLQEALVARVLVQRPGERGLEAREMGTTLGRVDVVGEREHGLDVGAVPLHRDLDGAVLHLALEKNDPLVDRLLGRVHVRDEVPDPALVVELMPILALSLVGDDDPQPARQECRLPQALNQRLDRPFELLLVEDLEIGEEGDRRAGVLLVLGLADDLEVGDDLAARELLAVDLAVAVNLELQPLGERVDHRDADAVEAAGDLVALATELPAGVELGEHDRRRGSPCSAITSTGMPEPLSEMVTELSGWSVTSIRSARPASASSTELSTTS